MTTDIDLARRLVDAQFPRWRGLPLVPYASGGSDNVIFRLGDELAVRLPNEWASGQAAKENLLLPRLAPHLPLAVPEPVGLGVPALGFPWEWSVSRWLDGEAATVDGLADPSAAAAELAGFLKALQGLALAPEVRAAPDALPGRDRSTREAIAAVEGVFDTGALTEVWEDALAAPAWPGPPVWQHGDMHNGNLLTVGGRLSAVIDFGGLGAGDPACDLVVAWTLFEGEAREVFRSALDVDDATWARGRGWAVSTGLSAYVSYAATRPSVAANTSRQIRWALSDRPRSRGGRR
ncbi:MAG TPA: aminoglycoside phosphotransferase family protein [Phytomonospora sp.]